MCIESFIEFYSEFRIKFPVVIMSCSVCSLPGVEVRDGGFIVIDDSEVTSCGSQGIVAHAGALGYVARRLLVLPWMSNVMIYCCLKFQMPNRSCSNYLISGLEPRSLYRLIAFVEKLLHFNFLKTELQSCNSFRNVGVTNEGGIGQMGKFGPKIGCIGHVH